MPSTARRTGPRSPRALRPRSPPPTARGLARPPRAPAGQRRHAEEKKNDEGGHPADHADGEVARDVATHRPRRLPQDAPYEGLVPLREEPHPGVDVPVAAQDQEERERKHGRQRGEEGGGAYGYLPGGREEVPYHLAQLLPQIGQLGIEPLQEPTEAVLLGEALDVLRRPFGRLGRGVDELGKTVYL